MYFSFSHFRLHRSITDMQRVMMDSVHFLLSKDKANYKEQDPALAQVKPVCF